MDAFVGRLQHGSMGCIAPCAALQSTVVLTALLNCPAFAEQRVAEKQSETKKSNKFMPALMKIYVYIFLQVAVSSGVGSISPQVDLHGAGTVVLLLRVRRRSEGRGYLNSEEVYIVGSKMSEELSAVSGNVLSSLPLSKRVREHSHKSLV